MRKVILLVIALLLIAPCAYAGVGGPHLWLSTDPNCMNEGGVGYVGESSDPWMADSYVGGSSGFRMYLYNASKSYTAHNVALMVAVHDYEALLGTGSVTITNEFGETQVISSFPHTDLNDTNYGGGSHGVYYNPKENGGDAMFAIYFSDTEINLAPETRTWFDISKSVFTQVHFDTYSDEGEDKPFYNPASHDVTMTPEPASMSLLGVGLLGLLAKRRRG